MSFAASPDAGTVCSELPQHFYKTIVEGSHDAVIVADGDSRVIFANQSAERLFGVALADMVGGSLDRLIPENARAAHHAHIRHMRESTVGSRPMGERGRVRGLHASGAELPIEGTILWWDWNGAPYYAAILRDASATIAQEGHLRRVATEAKRLVRMRSDFLAQMSHELRTPLNAVIGFSEAILFMAAKGGTKAKYHEYAQHIADAGRHLLALVNDVLDMSRLESSKRLLHEEDLKLRDVAQQVARLLSERAARAGQKIELDIEPGTVLHADAVALPQILVNLVANSLKYGNRGGTVRIAAEHRPDGRLRIGVSDEGVGMSAAEIERATRPFERFVKQTTDDAQGSGLGLAIVDALVKLHGAEMTIESTPGVGTNVHLLFPAERVRVAG